MSLQEDIGLLALSLSNSEI